MNARNKRTVFRFRPWQTLGLLALLALAACLISCGLLDGVDGALEDQPPLVPEVQREVPAEWDARNGASLLVTYGCSSCHTIPGIREANATVGPPLNRWADRHYIAGSLVNTPENLLAWVLAPQTVEPGTAMPNTEVTAEQVQDIAAYLYTLRDRR